MISASQQRLRAQIAEMRTARFMPVGGKISYPQDYPEKKPVYQPFPTQSDEISHLPPGPAERFP